MSHIHSTIDLVVFSILCLHVVGKLFSNFFFNYVSLVITFKFSRVVHKNIFYDMSINEIYCFKTF